MDSLFFDNTSSNTILDFLHSDEPQIFADTMDQPNFCANDNLFPELNFSENLEPEPFGFEFELM